MVRRQKAVARCARPDRPTAGLHDGWPAVAPSALLTGTADRAAVNGPVALTTRGRTARFSCLWALPDVTLLVFMGAAFAGVVTQTVIDRLCPEDGVQRVNGG